MRHPHVARWWLGETKKKKEKNTHDSRGITHRDYASLNRWREPDTVGFQPGSPRKCGFTGTVTVTVSCLPLSLSLSGPWLTSGTWAGPPQLCLLTQLTLHQPSAHTARRWLHSNPQCRSNMFVKLVLKKKKTRVTSQLACKASNMQQQNYERQDRLCSKLQRYGTTFPLAYLPRDLEIRSLARQGWTAKAPGVRLHAPPPLRGFLFGHYTVSTSRLIAILVGCGRGGGWILRGFAALRLEIVRLGTFWVPLPHRVGVQGHFRAPCT